ncbi:hypothetical protein MNBD_GAMMA06-1251 [hydrothermal vent metagenome]|uniref:Outer membrane protein beta-barrel domain-containing protein n=1 Tax=hydrothermal vent metagenome TaxID=652676 RepID=A0A3B0X6C3_9ZZZZ
MTTMNRYISKYDIINVDSFYIKASKINAITLLQNKIFIKKFGLLSLFIFICFYQINSVQADTILNTEKKSNLIVRPFAGIGYTDGADLGNGDTGSGTGYHVGLRLMLGANKTQRFGFEYTYLDLYGLENNSPDIRYSALGLVIEQNFPEKNILISIGTIGYVGIGDNSDNPFGVRTNIGWEGGKSGEINPFIVWRGDYIFANETIVVYSLSAGLRLSF